MSRKASDEEQYSGSGARSGELIDVVDVRLMVLDPGLPAPSYARPGDAGADLHLAADTVLEPGQRKLVGTGVAVALPEGYVRLVHPRSGPAARHGLSIVNAPGTVDAGYRGEIKVCLINTDTSTPTELSRGDRIAQLVIQRVSRAHFVTVSQLPGSIRGSDGHGSTGGMPAEPTNEPVGTVRADVRPDDTDSTPQENR